MTINAITASDKALLLISKDNKTYVYSLPSNDPGIDSLIKTKLTEKGV